MINNKVQVVLYVQLSPNNKKFLIFKTNKKRGNFWQNVTGSAEKGESFLDAAKREVHEETNCNSKNILEITDLEIDFQFKDQWGFEVHEKVFAFKIDENFEIKIDPNEHDDFKWITQEEISPETLKYSSNQEALFKCLNL